jgi:hypothetical protein
MPDLPISSLPAATTGYPNSLLVIVNYNPISTGRTEAVPFSAITSSISGTNGNIEYLFVAKKKVVASMLIQA